MLHCGNEMQVSKRNTLLYFLHLVNILMFYALVSTLVFECDRSPKDNCGVFHCGIIWSLSHLECSDRIAQFGWVSCQSPSQMQIVLAGRTWPGLLLVFQQLRAKGRHFTTLANILWIKDDLCSNLASLCSSAQSPFPSSSLHPHPWHVLMATVLPLSKKTSLSNAWH